VTFSEETEEKLIDVFGGLSVALARSLRIVDSEMTNPSTEHWDRAFTLFRMVI
jgi:hypothetical protein